MTKTFKLERKGISDMGISDQHYTARVRATAQARRIMSGERMRIEISNPEGEFTAFVPWDDDADILDGEFLAVCEASGELLRVYGWASRIEILDYWYADGTRAV